MDQRIEGILTGLDEATKAALLLKLQPAPAESPAHNGLLSAVDTADIHEDGDTSQATSYDDRKIPALAKFSGGKAKGETSYRKWKYEILELKRSGCPEDKLRRAIQKSLFGVAADAFMFLGSKPSVDNVIKKFDTLYKTSEDTEAAFTKFYAAVQSDESLAEWYTKLEALLNDDCLDLDSHQKETMLRSRFWKGLANSEIKNGLRHRYDNGASSMELLEAARIMAEEKRTSVQHHPIHADSIHQKLDRLTSDMSQLTSKLQHLETELRVVKNSNTVFSSNQPHASTSNGASTFNGKCYKCKRRGHKAYQCRKPVNSSLPVSGGDIQAMKTTPR